VTDRRLRVLTPNLWGTNGPRPERRSVLVAGIRALNPDLVAVQEAVGTDVVGALLGR
jgi:hypothetical protein